MNFNYSLKILIVCSIIIILTIIIPIHNCSSSGSGGTTGMTSRRQLLREKAARLDETKTLVGLSTLKVLFLIALPFILVFPIIVSLAATAFVLIQFPILSLTTPVTGLAAAVGRRYNVEDGIEQLFHEVSGSVDCISRISCEIGRGISSTEVRTIVDHSLNDLSPYLTEKWRGTISGYVSGSNGRESSNNNCLVYHCNLGGPEPVEDWNF